MARGDAARGGKPARVEFSPALSAKQRAQLHAFCERHGLEHASHGDAGSDRRIVVGDLSANARIYREMDCVRDEDVVEALCRRLGVSATLEELRDFGEDASDGDGLARWTKKTMDLLELEREAEEAQAQEILRGLSPEAAARRGRALLGIDRDGSSRRFARADDRDFRARESAEWFGCFAVAAA